MAWTVRSVAVITIIEIVTSRRTKNEAHLDDGMKLMKIESVSSSLRNNGTSAIKSGWFDKDMSSNNSDQDLDNLMREWAWLEYAT